MKDEIVKIVENKDYLTELLSKNTLEEIIEFCKSKGVEMTIDDAKEFVELIQSFKVEVEKSKSGKQKLNDNELVDKVVGGYYSHVCYYSSNYDKDQEVKREIKYDKALARTIVKSIVGATAGIAAVGLLVTGGVFAIKNS